MPNTLHYRLRIRTADDTADALVLSTVPSDAHPYLVIPDAGPNGDGQSIDPVTADSLVGSYTVRVIDASGTAALGDVVVASDDLESYADTAAALAAGWSEVDDAGIVTIALDPSFSDQGTQSIKAVINGTLGGGQTAKLLRTFTTDDDGNPLVVGHSYTIRKRAYFIGTWSGVPLNQWLDFDDGPQVAVDDGTGAGLVTASVFVVHGGSVAVNATVWIDNVRVIDVGASAATDRVVTSALADADGRWDILDRRAFLEESADVGGSWAVLCAGYVTDVKYDDALVAGITVSEGRRGEAKLRIFDTWEEGLGTPTAFIGGPIPGGFAGVPDYGAPIFKVTAVDSLTVTLQYESGPLPPFTEDGTPVGMLAPEQAYKEILSLTSAYFVRSAEWASLFLKGYFPGLRAALTNPTTGATIGAFTPLAGAPGGMGADVLFADRLFRYDRTIRLDWPAAGAVAQPSVGTRAQVRVFATAISEQNPLHLVGNPIDIDTAISDAKGIAYDAASAAAVREAIGGDTAYLFLRLTRGDTVGAFRQRALRGPFGYTVRQKDDGRQEYILVRPRASSTPTATITLDDLRDGGNGEGPDGVVFDLDAGSKRNVVTVNTLVFRRWTPEDGERGVAKPADYVLATPASVTEELDSDADGIPDWQTQGRNEVLYDIPGAVGYGIGTAPDGGTLSITSAIAQEVFAIRGRGAPTGEAKILRGVAADAARVGDFVLVDMDHVPAADPTQSPAGVRGGTVVAQVLRRTRVGAGADLFLEYRGTATQTGLVPAFTLTKHAGDPRHTATFALTNAAALSAAGAKVRVEIATGASAPTTGAPLRVFDPAVGPTTFDLPGQDAGTTVWARARAEVGTEAPGAWSAWESVALDALTAPSALSASASGNVVTMAWTVGDADVPEEVVYKLSGEADWRAPIPIPAGTDHYTLILPAAGTWTVGVRERERAPYNGVSAVASASVTTATGSALTPPEQPAVFSDGAGTFGGEVTGTVFPSDTEMWVAVETSAGSGTAGTYALAATVATVQNGRTRLTAFAPNDGLLRFVEFRHTQSGATASAFTTPLSVAPWTQTSLPPELPTLSGTLDASGNITVTWTNGPHGLSIRLAADVTEPADATVDAATAVNGQTGTFAFSVAAGSSAVVKAVAYTNIDGGGTASAYVTLPLIPAGGVTDADFLVKTAHSGLSAERVVTDTADIVWDWSTAGQAKATLADLSPSPAGTYGDGSTIPQITVDDQGRVTGVSEVAVVGGGGGSGAETLITETVIAATTASVTFSSIPGTYRDLRVVVRGRGDVAGTDTNVLMRFNGDTGGNYDVMNIVQASGSTNNFSANTIAGTSGYVASIAGSTAPSGVANGGEARILDYRGTTFQKMWEGLSGIKRAHSSGSLFTIVTIGYWRSTAAITSITLFPTTGNFAAGSVISLYGIS